ncbi:transglycosylase domain-containing protein [Sphaerimonospora cavernae]|uniref:Transglycosylase domain-containing protein n=1 Tax=Sphaerimonospora cavernae TaxID=1740611 RepID=A0ABV6U7J5_9ACTN
MDAAFEDTAAMNAVAMNAAPPPPPQDRQGRQGSGRPPEPARRPGPGGRPGGGPGGPGGTGGEERTQITAQGAMGMPPGGGPRREFGAQETEIMSSGGRRRRPGRGRGGSEGPDGPGGPGGRGPEGPGGRGPRDPGGPDGPDDFEDDEKPRRSGWKRFVPSWKIVLASCAVLTAGVFGMIIVGYMNTDLPSERDAQETAISQGSVFYYRDGTPIARIGTKRTRISIDQVPQHVRDAVVAAENRSFYEDSGIDLTGIARSVWMTATGQQTQGGSTITQQMARNYFDTLNRDVTIKRKVTEIFISVKLDKEWSKDKVLEYYLNTVPFGRNTYGIEAAAKEFFRKSAKDLTVAQGAYLAGRIQRPGDFDKQEDAGNFAGTQERFSYVIKDGMAHMTDENGKLKYPDIAATAKFPKPKPQRVSEAFGGLKGYMISEAIHELNDRGIDRDRVENGGFKIYTTFDKKLMQEAKKAVKGVTSGMSKEFHAGLAAVDPRNGQVLAIYGGDDYLTDPWNEPFDSKKQAASAFKPYVLAAWLEAGYSLNSWLPGNQTVPKELPGQAKGGITNGHSVPPAIDAIYATSHSINTAFASMAYRLDEVNNTIGELSAVKQIVEEAGLNKNRMEKDIAEHKYQFSIGSALVTPVEQAAGYSIFANQGKHVDYHVIKEVKQGKTVVLTEKKDVKHVISPDSAADAVVAMEQVLKGGTAAGKGIGRPAAGKTGTNNDEKEAWFVGFTPQLSTAVGMYREQCKTKSGKIVQPIHANCPVTPNGKPSKKYSEANPYSKPFETSLGFEGAGPPTSIWRNFMMAAHEGKQVEQFPPKAGIGMPENIAPSPTPTPEPTDEFPTDEFPTDDFPTDDFPTDPPPGPSDSQCLPDDPACGDDGVLELQSEGGRPFGGDQPVGNGAPAAVAATPVQSTGKRRGSAG